jgi:hypothetical protein
VVIDNLRPYLGGNLKGGDDRCEDHGVWDYLIETFKVKSIFDVGCGEGQLMKYFFDKGCEVYGSEGLEVNKQNAHPDIKDNISIVDYTKESLKPKKVDLTISCEFVEHVNQEFMYNYMHQFLACKYLAFTHGNPGQQGHNHVNCQTDEYWIDKLTGLGMTYLPNETKEARSRIGWTFWGSVLIFKK